jgi:hypothetical protein
MACLPTQHNTTQKDEDIPQAGFEPTICVQAIKSLRQTAQPLGTATLIYIDTANTHDPRKLQLFIFTRSSRAGFVAGSVFTVPNIKVTVSGYGNVGNMHCGRKR